MKRLSIFIFISFLIVGCEPCDDCGPVNNYPYFNLSVLNRTSLDTLQTDSTRYSDNLEIIEVQLKSLRDSLEAIEQDSLNLIPLLEDEIAILEIQDSLFTDSLSSISSIISIVKDRLIIIESINDKNDLFIPEEGESDSASSFRIPLNAGARESAYEIRIGETSVEKFLRVSYSLQDTVINNRITKTAKNLQIEAHDFDSIRGPFGCSPVINCSSNQLNIYVEI